MKKIKNEEKKEKKEWPQNKEGVSMPSEGEVAATPGYVEEQRIVPEDRRITHEMREEFRKPFPDSAYSKHPSKSFLTTLKAMYVVERLNLVVGMGRWDLKHQVISTDNNYVLMKGRLCLFDYDCVVPEQYGGHVTAGKNKEAADGYKSAVTDLLSKSASYLEIGIDLFKGKINPGSTLNSNEGIEDQTTFYKGKQVPVTDVPPYKRLTQGDIKLWDGTIDVDVVEIGGVKTRVYEVQIVKLKAHEKYVSESY